LESNGIAVLDRLGNGVHRRGELSQLGVLSLDFVESAGDFPDDSGARLAGQCGIHSIPAAEVKEIASREHPAILAGFRPLEDLAINRLYVLSHVDLKEKLHSISDKTSVKFASLFRPHRTVRRFFESKRPRN
jgi:hypothetical protein